MAVQLIVGAKGLCLISSSYFKAEEYNVTKKTIPAPYITTCHNLPQPLPTSLVRKFESGNKLQFVSLSLSPPIKISSLCILMIHRLWKNVDCKKRVLC